MLIAALLGRVTFYVILLSSKVSYSVHTSPTWTADISLMTRGRKRVEFDDRSHANLERRTTGGQVTGDVNAILVGAKASVNPSLQMGTRAFA